RKERSPEGGGSYDLPYRILVPQKVENMLVAGKMVSTDRDPYLRFLQQTMVTGQAAGVAAAICATRNITPRDLEKDVSELQRILTAQGAILKGTH
ncbi:MAG: FAD-dependent oxidoreductase, partial [Actinomycetota bacterium]